jgi:hypothetical protein
VRLPVHRSTHTSGRDRRLQVQAAGTAERVVAHHKRRHAIHRVWKARSVVL